jgi:polyisoprenoid-binding protein YceI/mono/diheme cytochrome c family protein
LIRSLLIALVLLSLPAAAGTWVVAPRPHGEVTFKVEGPLDDVMGKTLSVSGTLELDEKDWARGKGVVSVQLDALRTGIDQRDQDMRIEFLQTERYPYALLQVERIDRPSAATLAPGQTVQGEAVGSFEVHGVRRAIRIPVTLKLEDATSLWVHGKFEVPFSDYAISRPTRLFLKLGDTADAEFNVLFKLRPGEAKAPAVAEAPPTPPPPTAPTVATVQPAAPKARPRPAKKPLAARKITMLFATTNDLKTRGEQLFHNSQIGSVGNKLSCAHCHAKTDERAGIVQEDKFAREASSLWNASKRGVFWGGLADDVGKASNICNKRFMGGAGLGAQQLNELKAFLDAVSPDPAPPLNYAAFYQTLQSPLPNPTGGNAVHGREMNARYCDSCHENARAAPRLEPGLYEPEWIVRRVRWLEGHQSTGCPPVNMTRLTDSELRDIVTWLAGPTTEKVFTRKQ